MKDFMKSIAPSLATALLGPLGGIAASFIADKIGVDEKTVEAVTTAISGQKLTPDQLAGIKQAEIEFQKFCKQNEIDLEKLNVENIKDARAMQVATRSWVPSALSLIVVVGYFGILIGLMFGVLKVTDNQSLLILVGALATAFGGILNFWFGSTNGSQTKTNIIAQSSPVKP